MKEMKDKIFGVKKNVFWLGIVSFFNDFSSEMVQSVMPVFLTVGLGAPAFFVGLIEGIADALSSIFKLISGWISDKTGKRKNPAILGYSLSTLTRLFLILVTNFWQVFALRVVDRIGKGFRDSPRDALITESVEKEELGISFNFHRMLDTLGATLGPLLGFFIIFSLPEQAGFKDNYRFLFFIAFLLGLLAVFSFVFVKEKKKDSDKKYAKKLDWSIFKQYKSFIFVVGSLFVLGLGALPIGLVLLKAKEIGSIGNVPLMYFVYSLTFVIVAVPIGKLSDRVGERVIIGLGFLLAIIAYIGLALTTHLATLVIFFIILGIYSAATDGIQRVLAAKALHEELIATGQGFLNMALGFSSLGAGLIGGFLWTWQSSQIALLYAAIASFVGLILFITVSNLKKT